MPDETRSTSSSTSRMPGDGDDAPPSPADSFKSAGRSFAEFQAFLSHYLAAKADLLKLSIRKLLTMVVLGVVALVIGCAMLATAGVLVLVGLANWIAAIFDPPKPWVGQIIVGGVVLGGVVLIAMITIRRLAGASRSQTTAKYEGKRAEQRAHFGEDVASRASEAPNN